MAQILFFGISSRKAFDKGIWQFKRGDRIKVHREIILCPSSSNLDLS